MLYAYSLLYLMGSSLYMSVSLLYTNAKAKLFAPLLALVSLAVSLPVFFQFVVSFEMASGHPVSMNSSNAWQIIGSAASAAILLSYFAFDFVQIRKEANPALLRVGRNSFGVICTALVIFTTVDHFMFFHEPEFAGTVDLRALRAVNADVDDLDCEAGTVIVANIKENPVRYRCPMNLILGAQTTSTPFIPWPAYKEGHSAQLGLVLRKLLSQVAPQQ